jgi:hypothetical protein
MDTASPRDIARLLQTRERGEKAVPGERIPLAHGELCGRAPHHMDRDQPGNTLQKTGAARVR